MKRREFLNLLGSSLIMAAIPCRDLFALESQLKNILILIELKGGNDGLNTVIPFTQREYYKQRPSLAISKTKVLKINRELGFNPELTALHKLFQNKQLAIIEGVGYPNPNLSHFRSIDIWDTASKSHEYLSDGWIARAMKNLSPTNGFTEAIILGDSNLGPLRGKPKGVLAFNNPKSFIQRAKKVKAHHAQTDNLALKHILNIERSTEDAMDKLIRKKSDHRLNNLKYPQGAFGKNIKVLLNILSVEKNIPVLKLTLSGFDTHVNQARAHTRLMKALNDGMQALEKGLKSLGLWNQSLVLTYSEFGRRVKENRSKGTDHGTANVHFATGGRVIGGIYGQKPSLSRLNDGNLVHNVNFNSIYSTVLEKWWGLSSQQILRQNNQSLGFIRA